MYYYCICIVYDMYYMIYILYCLVSDKGTFQTSEKLSLRSFQKTDMCHKTYLNMRSELCKLRVSMLFYIYLHKFP